jgi:hypothetical protein
MSRDVFPAEVLQIGGPLMTKVRVFITSHRMIVWGLDASGLPEKKLEVDIEPSSVFASRAVLGPNERIEVSTLARDYIVNKGRGCGCSGPLSQLKAIALPSEWRKR